MKEYSIVSTVKREAPCVHRNIRFHTRGRVTVSIFNSLSLLDRLQRKEKYFDKSKKLEKIIILKNHMKRLQCDNVTLKQKTNCRPSIFLKFLPQLILSIGAVTSINN